MTKYALAVALTLGLAAGVAAPLPAHAHHPIAAKFDDDQPLRLSGLVTAVDWKNPHVHIYLDVERNGEVVQWAVELHSVNELRRNGWREHTVAPGTELHVEGIAARDGSPQIWGNRVTTGNGRAVFTVTEAPPFRPLQARPVPRWDDGRPQLGIGPGTPDGYWAYPGATSLVQDGVEIEFVDHSPGLLRNLDDVSRVAPFQPWAEALYLHRQQRHLREDPLFINCKPPGGPRQFQLPQGVQFIEDRTGERVFVLVGGGNSNYRIIYTDGRPADDVSQWATGDDIYYIADDPVYYGRSSGRWEEDTLVVESATYNEDFWFSNGGLPHTGHLRLTERFTRVDHDTLEYQVTVDDSGAYTQPWTATWNLHWVSGQDLPYHFCQENRP